MSAANPIPTAITKAVDSVAPLRKTRADTDGAESLDGVAGFSLLLQAAGLPMAAVQAAAEVVQTVKSAAVQPETEQADGAVAQVLSWAGGAAQSVMQSLVGQTAQLDQSGDVAMRNGTHLQARQEAGDPLKLSHQGQQPAALATHFAGATPVVAQGVVTQADAGSQAAGAGLQLGQGAQAGVAASVLAQTAGQVLGDVAAAMKMDGDVLQRGDRAGEGRMALDGQWVVPDRQAQPTEAMQRLMGQMSQFLAATGAPEAAGLRRSGSKSGDGSDSTVGDAAAAHGYLTGGSGRLMDSAVAQTAASQQAGDAQSAHAEPDMKFWMNARHQRAELVLSRDGEPVRVQVALDGNTAHVTFLSDAQATRSQLDASLSQLRDMLAAQGVELAGVQVQTQAGGGQQAGGDRQQSAFMPDGAQRVRLRGGVALEGVVPQIAAGHAARTAQGVDVFA